MHQVHIQKIFLSSPSSCYRPASVFKFSKALEECIEATPFLGSVKIANITGYSF